MRAAIFLERDGILAIERAEGKQLISPLTYQQIQPNREALEPLRQLKAAGFLLIGTTNQPGLSTGALSRSELDRTHASLRQFFALDDLVVCPHTESDLCPCRKPRPGLLTEATFKWRLKSDQCFVVSNKWQDAEAALNAGCVSLLVQSPWIGSGHHDIVLPNLDSVAAKILQLHHPAQALVAQALSF